MKTLQNLIQKTKFNFTDNNSYHSYRAGNYGNEKHRIWKSWIRLIFINTKFVLKAHNIIVTKFRITSAGSFSQVLQGRTTRIRFKDDEIRIRPDKAVVYCWTCVLIVGRSSCYYKIWMFKTKEDYQYIKLYTAFFS